MAYVIILPEVCRRQLNFRKKKLCKSTSVKFPCDGRREKEGGLMGDAYLGILVSASLDSQTPPQLSSVGRR